MTEEELGATEGTEVDAAEGSAIEDSTEENGTIIRDTDIVFDCPHCGHNLAIDYRGAGLQVTCVRCGEAVSVPIPEYMHIDDLDVEPGEILKQLFKTRRMLRDAENRIVELEEALDAANARIAEDEAAAEAALAARSEISGLAATAESAVRRIAALSMPPAVAETETAEPAAE